MDNFGLHLATGLSLIKAILILLDKVHTAFEVGLRLECPIYVPFPLNQISRLIRSTYLSLDGFHLQDRVSPFYLFVLKPPTTTFVSGEVSNCCSACWVLE